MRSAGSGYDAWGVNPEMMRAVGQTCVQEVTWGR